MMKQAICNVTWKCDQCGRTYTEERNPELVYRSNQPRDWWHITILEVDRAIEVDLCSQRCAEAWMVKQR